MTSVLMYTYSLLRKRHSRMAEVAPPSLCRHCQSTDTMAGREQNRFVGRKAMKGGRANKGYRK
jgi:hypothetical protein